MEVARVCKAELLRLQPAGLSGCQGCVVSPCRSSVEVAKVVC